MLTPVGVGWWMMDSGGLAVSDGWRFLGWWAVGDRTRVYAKK